MNRRRIRSAVAAGAILLSAALGLSQLAPVQGAGVSWTNLQPVPLAASAHGVVWQLAAAPSNPNLLVAATSLGVFVSKDDGQSWQESSVTDFAWTVAFSPQGALYAGTAHRGIFRSTNLGHSWSQDNSGLGNLDVRAIATGPTGIAIGTAGGVFISGDGQAWASAGLRTVDVSSLAIVQNSPLGVVAGADGQMAPNNLYRNLNTASSLSGAWQPLPAGDPNGAPVFSVAAGPLAQGSTSPPILVGNQKGLFESNDGGTTWVQRTLAGGVSWTVDTIAFDPQNPLVAYVGGNNGGSTGGGLQRSLDGGASWGVWQGGLSATDVNGLQALDTNPLTVLAAVWNGSTRESGVAKLVDTSAPGPVPLVAAIGPVISINSTPTPTPTPATHHRSVSSSVSIPLWVWPAGLLVVIVVVALVALGLRRRRARLEVEAPP